MAAAGRGARLSAIDNRRKSRPDRGSRSSALQRTSKARSSGAEADSPGESPVVFPSEPAHPQMVINTMQMDTITAL